MSRLRSDEPRFWAAVLATVVSLADFRLARHLQSGRDFQLSIDAALGVLQGTPHWRIYQNRVLAPGLIKLLTYCGLSVDYAYLVGWVGLMTVAGYLALTFLWRLYGDQGLALAGFLALHLLFVFSLGRLLYIWDLSDLVIFVIFSYLVLRDAPLRSFVGLFIVAIFNRESAYFIAAWLVVQPVAQLALKLGKHSPSARGFDTPMFLTGLTLSGAGILIVEALRTILLKQEMGPILFGPIAGAGQHLFYMWPTNKEEIIRAVGQFNLSLDILVPSFFVGYLAFAARVASIDPTRCLALAAVHAVWLLTLPVTGLVFETRVFVGLLPFLAMTAPTAMGCVVGTGAVRWRPQSVPDHILSQRRHFSSADERIGG